MTFIEYTGNDTAVCVPNGDQGEIILRRGQPIAVPTHIAESLLQRADFRKAKPKVKKDAGE